MHRAIAPLSSSAPFASAFCALILIVMSSLPVSDLAVRPSAEKGAPSASANVAPSVSANEVAMTAPVQRPPASDEGESGEKDDAP
jgi:hypothetical protein